jgi:ribosome biogenesis protein UTP30
MASASASASETTTEDVPVSRDQVRARRCNERQTRLCHSSLSVAGGKSVQGTAQALENQAGRKRNYEPPRRGLGCGSHLGAIRPRDSPKGGQTQAHSNVREAFWRSHSGIDRVLSRSAVPHTLLDPERGVSLCVLVKDPQSAFEDVLEEHPVPGFDRVIGYKQLRDSFKEFKQRRELLKEHDEFFCDDRILPMLPRLVGKTFFQARKHPLPVRISKVMASASAEARAASLDKVLGGARDATWIRLLGQGVNFSVKAGFPFFTPSELVDNVMEILKASPKHVEGGWHGLQAVYLKSTTSLPLPLFATIPDPALAKAAKEAGAVTEAPKPVKRAREDEEEEDSTSKRSKGVKGGKEAVRSLNGALGGKQRRKSKSKA